MKKLKQIAVLLLLPALVLTGTSFKARKDDPPMIKFEKILHDFGKMKAGESKTCEFVYTNNGDLPLKIINVKSGLDFLKTEYSTDPLKKGEKASIKVTLDAPGRNGSFAKTIIIDSNSSGATGQLRVTVKALFSTE